MEYIKDFQSVRVEPSQMAEHVKKLITNHEQERFIAVYLSNSGEIISSETLFIGGSSSSIVDNKILFRHALLNKAEAIIIAHNHPSNNLEPSAQDIQTTNKIKQACELLNIKLLDHIIINSLEQFTSFNLLKLI